MSQLLTPASLDDLLKDTSSSSNNHRRSSEFTKTQKNYSRGSSSDVRPGHSTGTNTKITNVLKSIQEMDERINKLESKFNNNLTMDGKKF